MNGLTLESIHVEERLGALKHARSLSAIALSCSKRSMIHFSDHYPQHEQSINQIYDSLWSMLNDSRDLISVEECSKVVDRMLPTFEDSPYAGASLPAGEAVLMAINNYVTPDVEGVAEVIELGYTANEMAAFLAGDVSATEGGSRAAEALSPAYEQAAESAFVQEYLKFVDGAITAMEDSQDISILRI